jgi:hypothetical protein
MTAVLIVGAAAGIGLGLARFKIFALFPAILIVAAGTFGGGLASGLQSHFIGMTVLAAIVSLQVGYLLGFLGAGLIYRGSVAQREQPPRVLGNWPG